MQSYLMIEPVAMVDDRKLDQGLLTTFWWQYATFGQCSVRYGRGVASSSDTFSLFLLSDFHHVNHHSPWLCHCCTLSRVTSPAIG